MRSPFREWPREVIRPSSSVTVVGRLADVVQQAGRKHHLPGFPGQRLPTRAGP
jgi:hypothetical protein